MREIEKDLWRVKCDYRVITINLFLKNPEGPSPLTKLVMGRGCAKEALDRFPGLDRELGDHLVGRGQCVDHRVPFDREKRLIFFPVKPVRHRPREEKRDELAHPGWQCGGRIQDPWCRLKVMETILAHLPFLVNAVDYLKADRVAMPRPGCGWGGLDWKLVRPWLAKYLDDRFIVCHLDSKDPNRR